MRPVMLLAQLNEVDLVVDGVEDRLAEIVIALQEPEALSAARQALAEADAELLHCQTVQKDKELIQQSILSKLSRAETRLYSGKIRNPKELKGAEMDVQQLHRQKERAEDELLEALITAESATEQQTERAKALAQLGQDWAAKRKALQAEQAELQRQLPIEQARQATVRSAAPVELLPAYDRLRARRGGRAVAKLDGEMCATCGVAASFGKRDAARFGDELVYCGSCGRLLWGE